ncbi:unnamed protein product [Lathyrus oleraceus]|uniref:Uncharacterized protein n=1 Tax=Pisum sativum TaxID=3888 RepID=A0A9D4YLH2_PEA|nr:uncharacterized protein LOC127115802 [Pisum sativum]KAI5441776.1 hypothetical protein KIW84_011006 [Pisum sativum]
MTVKYYCMVMRINIDCNGCYRKVKRALLEMPELESHFLEKKQTKVIVCGRFIPQDVAIKIKKKTNRRVEILEIQDLSENNEENIEEQKPVPPTSPQKPIERNMYGLIETKRELPALNHRVHYTNCSF